MALTPTQIKEMQLLKILELTVDHLHEKGLLPEMAAGSEERNELIHSVANKVLNNIELEDIHQDTVKNALSLSLLTAFIASEKPELANKLEHVDLFDHDLPLKKHLIVLLTALNELIPDPAKRLTPVAINQQAEKLALQCKMKPNESLVDNEAALNKVSCLLDLLMAASAKDSLSDTLGALFSRDPRVLGGPQRVVEYNPGNLSGIVDQAGDNETSYAFIDVINKYDGGEDDFGIKNNIRGLLAEICAVLEQELVARGAYSTAPRPQGPLSY